MEDSNKSEEPDLDQFFDTIDEFHFFECIPNVESEGESIGSSKLSELKIGDNISHEVVNKKLNSSKPSFPDGIRRRSSLKLGRKGNYSGNDLKDSNSKTPIISEITEEIILSEENKKLSDLNKEKMECSISDSSHIGSDRIVSDDTLINQEKAIGSSINTNPSSENLNESSFSFLVFVAELMIKAISFQLNLFFSFFNFPIWVLYFSFLFVTNPLVILKKGKDSITQKLIKIWDIVFEVVYLLLPEQLKRQTSYGSWVRKFGWGLFWSIYICMILFCFLVFGFVISGLMMRYLVEKPIQISGTLNFDYSKSSPVALVPLTSCPSVSCGVNCKDKAEIGKYGGSRVIPLNHKLQLTVSLTLPESDYNKKLGIFQVKVEFLSANGRVAGSLRHPCMLRYKSQLITYLGTFLKSVPLLAGYSSEEQILKLNMRGFTEGYEPTSCIRVILEQRAEYRRGAGIPEIYASSLLLQSELPLYKRIMWYWKKTIFIWISMVIFLMQLMCILICCRPIIIPRTGSRNRSANNNETRNVPRLQGG